jgi:hypothetical protein
VVDAALTRKDPSPALVAFEAALRTSGASTLVDVLRLGRYVREG